MATRWNHQTIELSVIGKLLQAYYANIYQTGLYKIIFSEAQFGFRPMYGTVDVIYTIHVLINITKKKSKLGII